MPKWQTVEEHETIVNGKKMERRYVAMRAIESFRSEDDREALIPDCMAAVLPVFRTKKEGRRHYGKDVKFIEIFMGE